MKTENNETTQTIKQPSFFDEVPNYQELVANAVNTVIKQFESIEGPANKYILTNQVVHLLGLKRDKFLDEYSATSNLCHACQCRDDRHKFGNGTNKYCPRCDKQCVDDNRPVDELHCTGDDDCSQCTKLEL